MEIVRSVLKALRILNRKARYRISRAKTRTSYFSLYIAGLTLLRRRREHFAPANGKSVLVIRNDNIGDMLVSTPLIRNLHQAGWKISVVSCRPGLDMIAHNPYVAERIPYDGNRWRGWLRSLRMVREKSYDLAIDARHLSDIRHLLFASLVKARVLAGLNKKRLSSFNLSIPYADRLQHVTGEFKAILSGLGIEADDFHYDVHLDADSEKAGQCLADKLTVGGKRKLVLFNPFGRAAYKHFPDAFVAEILPMLRELFPEAKIVVIGRDVDLDTLPCLKAEERVATTSIFEAAALVRHVDLLVSVDTSLVHIASAFRKPSVCVYIGRPHESDPAKDPSYEHFRDVLTCRLIDYEELIKSRYIDGPDSRSYAEVDSLWDVKYTWAPNNPNAVQLYFEGKSIAHLNREELLASIRDACLRFQPLGES